MNRLIAWLESITDDESSDLYQLGLLAGKALMLIPVGIVLAGITYLLLREFA